MICYALRLAPLKKIIKKKLYECFVTLAFRDYFDGVILRRDDFINNEKEGRKITERKHLQKSVLSPSSLFLLTSIKVSNTIFFILLSI